MNTKLFKTTVFILLFFNVSIILLGPKNDTILLNLLNLPNQDILLKKQMELICMEVFLQILIIVN